MLKNNEYNLTLLEIFQYIASTNTTNTIQLTNFTTTTSNDLIVQSTSNDIIMNLYQIPKLYQLIILCFISYITEQRMLKKNPLEPLTNSYLLKFDAGSQLCYAMNIIACEYEKDGYKNYYYAIMIYECLLSIQQQQQQYSTTSSNYNTTTTNNTPTSTPTNNNTATISTSTTSYLMHRRGKWYKRLCVNYEHLHLTQCAIRAAYRAIQDPHVNVNIINNMLL